MSVEKLEIYKLSLKIGKEIWDAVEKWDYFAKDTVGKQIVRSIDSVAANISEGYGRYHLKEEIRFFLIARGSLNETKTFINIAYSRKLITDSIYNELIQQTDILGRQLNSFINALKKRTKNDSSKKQTKI